MSQAQLDQAKALAVELGRVAEFHDLEIVTGALGMLVAWVIAAFAESEDEMHAVTESFSDQLLESTEEMWRNRLGKRLM
jgi:hypothetical protein